MEDVLSSESINDVKAQKVSLSGFHGDNLLMYMLAMKQLSSATYVCLGRHKDFFVSCLKLMSQLLTVWRIEVYTNGYSYRISCMETLNFKVHFTNSLLYGLNFSGI